MLFERKFIISRVEEHYFNLQQSNILRINKFINLHECFELHSSRPIYISKIFSGILTVKGILKK